VNRPLTDVRTNQEGGAMSYGADPRGEDPSVNYEPSFLAGLSEADDSYQEYRPHVEGQVMKAPIDRTNDYGQAGNHYRNMLNDEERADMVLNFVTGLSQCDSRLQEKMLEHFGKIDEDLATRVAEGLKAGEGQADEVPDSTLV